MKSIKEDAQNYRHHMRFMNFIRNMFRRNKEMRKEANIFIKSHDEYHIL